MMVKPLVRAYSQTSSSDCPSSPHSRTCALSGKSVASKRGSLGERFSSKSSFMRNDIQASVPVCGKSEARLDVVGCEVRKIVEHFRYGHAAAEIIENISDGNARASDARLAAANARINGDALAVVHGDTIDFWLFSVKVHVETPNEKEVSGGTDPAQEGAVTTRSCSLDRQVRHGVAGSSDAVHGFCVALWTSGTSCPSSVIKGKPYPPRLRWGRRSQR